MLLTWVNLAYYQELMAGLRAAIATGNLAGFMAETKAGWEAGEGVKTLA
jgi:queuine tRNA-ribosyltransferase